MRTTPGRRQLTSTITDNEQNVIPDYTQLHKFYAPAGFDRRNVFNFQYVYNLPEFKGSQQAGAAYRRWLGVVRCYAVLEWKSLPQR